MAEPEQLNEVFAAVHEIAVVVLSWHVEDDFASVRRTVDNSAYIAYPDFTLQPQVVQN